MSRIAPATAVALLLALPAAAPAAPSGAAGQQSAHRTAHHRPAPKQPHHARPKHKSARAFSFYARVVRSGPQGVVLRTASGKTLSLSPKQISRKRPAPAKRHKHPAGKTHRKHAAADLTLSVGNVSVNVFGLQPGVMVLVTVEPDESGGTTISITLPPPSLPGVTSQLESSGVVSDVSSDSFTVQTGDGSSLRLHMAQDALAALGLKECDIVDVAFHQDAGMLIADKAQATGTSTTDDCAPGHPSGEDSKDAVGTITSIGPDSLTIATQDQGALTFATPVGLADGYKVGDVVDVTYTLNGDKLKAREISFVQNNAEGKVVAVTDDSVTVIDSVTGKRVTYAADPDQGLFDGVALRDHIHITYHHSGQRLVADAVGVDS
jgi:hypothetical protein